MKLLRQPLLIPVGDNTALSENASWKRQLFLFASHHSELTIRLRAGGPGQSSVDLPLELPAIQAVIVDIGWDQHK